MKVQAKKTTIIADADIVEKNFSEQTLLLKGNVNVIFKQQHLSCDKAIIKEKQNSILAEGHVIIQDAKTTIRADRLELNYKTNKGKIYNGIVTSGRVFFQSELIEKAEKDLYTAKNAYYTACLTCPASWGFTSSKITAKMGDYASIKNPWLYLLDFPVLPFPYLVVPLNAKRRTGFLVPKMSSNADNGISFEQPFFWAIDPSKDVTVSLINYEKRGLQVLGNYRYVLSPTSSGEFNGSFLKDQSNDYKKRWFTDYEHSWDFSKSFRQRTKIALVTDQPFVIDFPRQLNYSGYPALKNSFSLTKDMTHSLLTMSANYYISLIEAEPELLNENQSLHKMPEINFYLTDQKLSDTLNLFASLKLQYLNVTRYRGRNFERTRRGQDQCVKIDNKQPDFCYFNPTDGDQFIYGDINETLSDSEDSFYGDLIRAGQRFDLVSYLHSPFWLGSSLSLDPSVTLRYTQYALGEESDPGQSYTAFPHRFYTKLGFSTKAHAHRLFQWDETTKIKHTIIPEIDIQYIPKVEQTDHHFFGTERHLRYFREQQPIDDTDADWRQGGRGIQFDQNDRIIGQQIINLSITNRILSRSRSNDQKDQNGTNNTDGNIYKKNMSFRLSQAFDLKDAIQQENPQPWQDIRASAFFDSGPLTQSVRTSYFPYHRRFLWQTSTYYNFMPNNFLYLIYNKNYIINNAPPVDDSTKDELLFLGTGLNFKYFFFHGTLEYDLTARPELNENNFKRWTVSSRITPPGACWFIKGIIENRLDTGIVNYSVSMQFSFGE